MSELQVTARALLTMALILSGADVSMPAFELQDRFNIHRDINWPKTLLSIIN